MTKYQVFYVGTLDEVAHHAAPLESHIDISIVEPEKVASLAKPNDLAIFFSEHFHRFRKAWLELSNLGCNTLYAVDGILEWRNAWENRDDEPACPWTMRPVLCDKVACIGSSQMRVLQSWGNTGKCELVGVPRFDRFIDLTANDSATGIQQTAGPIRILVTTAKWPGFTDEQVAQVTRSLVDLKNIVNQISTNDGRAVEIVWRLTGDLAEVVGVTNQLNDTTGKELAEVLQDVDAVITTPSTVLLEAMLAGKPSAILDYTNSPRYVDAAWSITAADQIEPVLSQLAHPSARRMTMQQMLLNDALQIYQPATERLVQLIESMIRIGHDCRAANQPVSFPDHILAAPGSEAEETFHENNHTAALWPNHTELTAGGSIQQRNAVAAEALRRVDHLQDRVDLLERELSRAAEGFDRIANHPLLAPLVKVRKVAKVMGKRVAEILTVSNEDPAETQNENQETKNGDPTSGFIGNLPAENATTEVAQTEL